MYNIFETLKSKRFCTGDTDMENMPMTLLIISHRYATDSYDVYEN